MVMPATKIDAIIFDLGGVLIDWNPNYVFDKLFTDPEKKKYFFENVCTPDWNEQQDAGRTVKEATEDLLEKHPDWKEYIDAYYGRWEEMLGGPIQGTVEIFKQLKESGNYKIYALTNWSAELFPIALNRYEFLHWFDGRVVSGEEKMRKPFPEFYQLILNRFQLTPEETLFIDDSARNTNGAKEHGLNTLLFRSPEQLKEELVRMKIL
jgi:2-haloacid dehalogenase